MVFLTFFSCIDYYKILSRVTVLDSRFLFICLYIAVCICYSEIASLPLPTPSSAQLTLQLTLQLLFRPAAAQPGRVGWADPLVFCGLVTYGGSCLKPAQSVLVMLTFIPGRRKGGVHVRIFMTAKGERLGHSSVTSSPSTAAGGPGGHRHEDGGGTRDTGDDKVFVPSSPARLRSRQCSLMEPSLCTRGVSNTEK